MLTELYYFSEAWWRARFRARGFDILAVRLAGLYYSEGTVLGPRLLFAMRERLSRWFGTKCKIYVLKKSGIDA